MFDFIGVFMAVLNGLFVIASGFISVIIIVGGLAIALIIIGAALWSACDYLKGRKGKKPHG